MPGQKASKLSRHQQHVGEVSSDARTITHLAHLFNTQENRYTGACQFLKSGLDKGHRCIYITHHEDPLSVIKKIEQNINPLDKILNSAQLIVLDSSQCYLEGGSFHLEEWVFRMIRVAEETLESGYTGLTGIGDMTWSLGADVGSKRLMEYESLLNTLPAELNFEIMCEYDLSRFPGRLTHECILTHPTLMVDTIVCDNPFYLPPDEYLHPRPASKRVSRMIEAVMNLEIQKSHIEAQQPEDHKYYDKIRIVPISDPVQEIPIDENSIVQSQEHLTDILSRLLFAESLNGQIRVCRISGQALAIFSIDLDGFKKIKSRYGSDISEALICEAGNRIRSCLRKDDTYAQTGGDEFAAVASIGNSLDEAAAIASRLTKALSEPYLIEQESITSSACVGISIFPMDGEDAETLVRKADIALVEAKKLDADIWMIYTDHLDPEARLKAIFSA